MSSGVAKNVRDQEELLKCNAIIEQSFRTFEVIQCPCPIIIFFWREVQLYTLVALRMDSDNTFHEADMSLVRNYVSYFYVLTNQTVIIFPCRNIGNTVISGSLG